MSIKADPTQLMLKLVKILNVNCRTIGTAVNKDLVVKTLHEKKLQLFKCPPKSYHNWKYSKYLISRTKKGLSVFSSRKKYDGGGCKPPENTIDCL